MTEAAASGNERLEFEIRGGPWESAHVVIFYGAVACAVLATLGVTRLFLGISCVVLLLYSMFTMFSSPTFVMSDAAARELVVERYHYFIPSRSRIGREELEALEVVESGRIPAEEGAKSARRDLFYSVRIYLRRKNGRRMRLFSSGMTGAPSDNRAKAFLIVQDLSRDLDIPVTYNRRGRESRGAGEQPGA